MIKKIISLLIAFTAVVNTSALSVNADENEAIEVIKFDYLTKSSETYTIDMDSLIENNETMLEELELSEIETADANFPVESESISSGVSSGQAIFSTDEQIRVNPNDFPYSAVLQIRSGWDTNNDGTIETWKSGTGFLEGNDVMVTSGECFYDLSWGDVEECRIYSKHNSSTFSDTFNYPSSWILSTNYINNGDIESNWCLVTLADNLGGSNGWFGRTIGADADDINSYVTISGYPITYGKTGYQYKSSGAIESSSESLYYYAIDTEYGQSGAPIYNSSNNVIGINVTSINNSNVGIRINSYLYNMILNMYLEGLERWDNYEIPDF